LTSPAVPSPPARRDLWLAYATAPFVMGYTDVFGLLTPLYATSLGMSATEIGLLVGARSALGVVLSIPAGALMDRYGTRRLGLFFALGTVALAPLYPALHWFPALLLLQCVVGCLVSLIVSSGQTVIALLGHGEARYIGRWSATARLGTTVGPLIAGAVWDLGGPWPAYAMASLWGVPLALALLRLREPASAIGGPAAPPPRFRLRDALPRLSDYTSTFALLAVPTIAITIVVIFLRNATGGMQTSMYVVYLRDIGLTGTAIGALFAAVEIAHGVGAFFSGPAVDRLNPQWTLVATTALAIAFIAATPLLGGLFALLMLAQVARGLCQGAAQPLLFSIQSKAVGRHRQGAIVGLRQTMNRVAAILVPPVMGVAADRWGVNDSFLIVGAGLVAICAGLALAVARVRHFGSAPPTP